MRKKQEQTDCDPDCNCNHPEERIVIERDVDGMKVMSVQCGICKTYGRRPIGFIVDEDNIPLPNFETLEKDSEMELYYKLSFLSNVYPSEARLKLISKIKRELKHRFNALKYDTFKEGTLGYYMHCRVIEMLYGAMP